jgi:hypothetical protein
MIKNIMVSNQELFIIKIKINQLLTIILNNQKNNKAMENHIQYKKLKIKMQYWKSLLK